MSKSGLGAAFQFENRAWFNFGDKRVARISWERRRPAGFVN